MNNYSLSDEIGRGRFTMAYKGRLRKSVDYCAILSIDKCVRPYVLNCVHMLRSLQHPSIIQFFNWYETANHLWVITEYCTGGNLKSILELEKRLPEMSVRVLAGDVAMGLHYMHTRGVVNNDIKPSNLLMDSTASLRFYDFRLSCTFTTAAERTVVGTPLYMAPELFLVGKGVASVASDLWALGCLLHEMMTGSPPFSGNSLEELLTQIFLKPFARVSHASDAFNSLLEKLLEKDPFSRATWKDVAASDFWGEHVQLRVSALPRQPAFDAYFKENRGKPWSGDEILRAIQGCAYSAKFNHLAQPSRSDEGDFDIARVHQELNFTPVPLEDNAMSRANPSSSLVISDDVVARTAEATVAKDNNGHSNFASRNTAEPPAALRPKVPAMPTRFGISNGKNTDKLNADELQRPAGAKERAKSVRTEQAFLALLEASGASDIGQVNVEALLWHHSDAHIRPLSANNRIERYTQPVFDRAILAFPSHSIQDIKKFSSEQLLQHVSTIYERLLPPSASYDDKFNVMRYCESIAGDTLTANVLVNSSVMTLCTRFAGDAHATPAFRIAAASLMGLLVRHATILCDDLPASGVISRLTQLLESETSVRVKRKLLSCLGELLFYIAVQAEKERKMWGVDSDVVLRVFLDALVDKDDVLAHYAVKTVENVTSVRQRNFISTIFCTPQVVEALLSIYSAPTTLTRTEYMQSCAVCAAFKIAVIQPELISCVMQSNNLTTSSYGALLQSSPVPRTSQLLLTFLNYALVRALASTENSFTSLWAAAAVKTDDGSKSPWPILTCTVSVEEAETILADIDGMSTDLVGSLCEAGENVSAAMRGKTLLFIFLLGCLGGTSVAKLCCSRHVALLDRLMRDDDPYVRKCASTLASFFSYFITDKLGAVARRVSSSTITILLSAVQQLMSATTVRSAVTLTPETFRRLQECLEKSLSSPLYAPYEQEFNAIVEKIVHCPELVAKYHESICCHLVPPYTTMLQRKEMQQHFSALCILTAVIGPLAADRRAIQGDRKSVISAAVLSVISSVTTALPTLQKESAPIPIYALRLLVSCAECTPEQMGSVASESLLIHVMDFMTGAQESDLYYPLRLIFWILRAGNTKEFVAVVARQKLPALLIKTLAWSLEKNMPHLGEVCCELSALILESTLTIAGSRTANQCITFLDGHSIKTLFLPLCCCTTNGVQEYASAIVYYLLSLFLFSRGDLLCSEGVDALRGVLESYQNSPEMNATTLENLLRALCIAAKGQRNRQLSKFYNDGALMQKLKTVVTTTSAHEQVKELSAQLIGLLAKLED